MILTPSDSAGVGSAQRTRIAAAECSIAALTRQMTAGDEQAFREFHALYFHRLFGHVLVLTHGQEEETREALQDTLVRVARYVRPFHDEAVFWCWLTALARSAVRDRGRRLRRYQQALRNYALRFLCLLAPSFPEDQDSRLHGLLERALEELEAPDRALLRARYEARSTIRDIAHQTGQTERAVESRLLRLRRQLRERLLERLREESS